MDRFGSSRLRIGWTLFFLLIAGLVLGAVQGVGGDGNQIVVMGTGIPLGQDVVTRFVPDNLGRLLYTLVPAIILLGGFLPIVTRTSGTSGGERLKGLCSGTFLAWLNGLFYSQVAILPIFALSYRLMGNPFHATLLRTDLNAVILGMQLLLWAVVLSKILKSLPGLAILAAYALAELGKLVAWLGEFGQDMEVPDAVVKSAAFLGRVLPVEQLPGDALAWWPILLSLIAPFLLAALLMLLPEKAQARGGKPPKRSKA